MTTRAQDLITTGDEQELERERLELRRKRRRLERKRVRLVQSGRLRVGVQTGLRQAFAVFAR